MKKLLPLILLSLCACAPKIYILPTRLIAVNDPFGEIYKNDENIVKNFQMLNAKSLNESEARFKKIWGETQFDKLADESVKETDAKFKCEECSIQCGGAIK